MFHIRITIIFDSIQHMVCKCPTYHSFHSINANCSSHLGLRKRLFVSVPPNYWAAVSLWLRNSVICIFHCQQIITIACVSLTNTCPSLILHTNIEFTCRQARSNSKQKSPNRHEFIFNRRICWCRRSLENRQISNVPFCVPFVYCVPSNIHFTCLFAFLKNAPKFFYLPTSRCRFSSTANRKENPYECEKLYFFN